MSDMKLISDINPWNDLPVTFPYVLPVDRQYVDDYNRLPIVDDEYRFHTEIFPEPYAGKLDAMVVLLGFHPGYSDGDVDVHRSEIYQRLWRDNIAQTINDYPLFFLHSDMQETPAYSWWYKKLKPVIERTSIEQVAKSVLTIQLFAYHCTGLKRPKGELPSKGFAVKVVSDAIQRGALIIAMQSQKLWQDHVPSLRSYDHFFSVKNPRSGSISPGNLPDGFETVIEAIHGNVLPPTSKGQTTPNPKEVNYRPNKSDVDKAIDQISYEGKYTLENVLDQVAKNCQEEGKSLKSNWRMITERNIELWYK